MKRLIGWAIVATITCLAPGALLRADSTDTHPEAGSEAAPDAEVWNDLAWLVGRWQGEAFGGICEETWTAPSGGSMTGMFKLVSENRVVFYEIITITLDSAGQPVMKLKHFNADLTGWEERDEVIEFAYESHTADDIRFTGLTYRHIEDDRLRIVVGTKKPDGSGDEQVIVCRRVAMAN